MSEPLSTGAFQEAIAEAERLVRNASFIETEQDLAEGLDYLAGSIRSSIQMAFAYDLEHPVLINPTHQYSRQGLDNPDAIYFNAYLADGASYRLSGKRGTTADLSFQIMDGTYSADGAPGTVAAFDDRELTIAADGTFEWEFEGTKSGTLIIREVYDDWLNEERGSLRLQRLDTAGAPRQASQTAKAEKRFGVAAKMLTGRLKTWFAFPEWFTYKEPVNTLTTPKSTPGGLASQYSSIGHYELSNDQALVVTVPVAQCAYQAIQVGSAWYISTDYEHHQTSMTRAQSVVSGDGLLRYVISERNPGVANWLETTGHRRGVMMMRWQRLNPNPDVGAPTVELVDFDTLAQRPDLTDQRISEESWTKRIEARQVGIARRMIS